MKIECCGITGNGLIFEIVIITIEIRAKLYVIRYTNTPNAQLSLQRMVKHLTQLSLTSFYPPANTEWHFTRFGARTIRKKQAILHH